MQPAALSQTLPPTPSRASTQLRLPGLSLPDSRHLIPLEACQILLDLDEDSILGAIENGRLGWAWDIRTPGAERREIRVWRESLMAKMAGADGSVDTEIDQVVESILPHRDLRLMELARWFACSGSHVSNLIRDGCLALAGDRPTHSSAAAVTRVTRESVARFLDGRRVK